MIYTGILQLILQSDWSINSLMAKLFMAKLLIATQNSIAMACSCWQRQVLQS